MTNNVARRIEPHAVEPLTEREREIVALMARGLSNSQIGDALALTGNTVRWYLRRIYGKLAIEEGDKRREAVAKARMLGLLPLVDDVAVNHNIPASVTPLMGRELELEEVAELLRDPHVRVVSILGPGGAGKTRLAQAVALRLSGQPLYRDGVWYSSLAPVETIGLLPMTVAQSLGLELQGKRDGARDTARQVVDFVRRKRLLLVLDNVEHLLEGVRFLSRLLAEAPGLQLLVTSRERLQMDGEHAYWLGGLAVPKQDDKRARRSAAVRLFVHAAKCARHDFSLDEAALPAVARLSRLMEGMPLALELAAAWVAVLPPAVIEEEVKRGLGILKGGLRDTAQRHRSMEAALALSWERLAKAEQHVMMGLSVFSGGFTREAANEIVGGTPPILSRLVDQSWLTYRQDEDRYQIHELLRQYGAAQLARHIEADRTVRDKHSAFYCAALAHFALESQGAGLARALSVLRNDIHNVLLAWRWAVEVETWERLDEALAGLFSYCEIEGETDLAQVHFGLLLADRTPASLRVRALVSLAAHTFDIHLRRRYFTEAETLLPTMATDWSHRPAVLVQLIWHIFERDRHEALQILEAGTAEAEKRGDLGARAALLLQLAYMRQVTGYFVDARRHIDEGLVLVASSDNLLQRLELLHLACRLDWYQVRLDTARAAANEGLALARALGHEAFMRRFFEQLAWIEWLSGRSEEAYAIDKDLLTHYERSGDQKGIAQWHFCLARTLLHSGDDEAAMWHAQRCLDGARASGMLVQESFGISVLGSIALLRAKYEEAVSYYREGTALIQRVGKSGQPDEAASALAEMAMAELATGKVGAARASIVEALRIVLETRSFKIGAVLIAAALLALDEGQVEEALTRWSAAQRLVYVRESVWYQKIGGEPIGAAASSLPEVEVARAVTLGEGVDLWDLADSLELELA